MLQEMQSSKTKGDAECGRGEARGDVENAGEEAKIKAGEAVSCIHT